MQRKAPEGEEEGEDETKDDDEGVTGGSFCAPRPPQDTPVVETMRIRERRRGGGGGGRLCKGKLYVKGTLCAKEQKRSRLRLQNIFCAATALTEIFSECALDVSGIKAGMATSIVGAVQGVDRDSPALRNVVAAPRTSDVQEMVQSQPASR